MKRVPRIAIVIAILAPGLSARQWMHHRAGDGVAAPVAPAATKPAPPRIWKLGSLELKPCELPQPHSGLSTAAWCAPFQVPEDRAHPDGRKIALRLAVVRSSAQVPAPDMVAFIAGGPGQSAAESYPAIAPAMAPLLAHRNVLLLDQRGTGQSHPLSCRDDDETGVRGGNAAARVCGAEAVRKEPRRCLDQLSPDGDVRFYTTTEAVADLEDARRALGSPKFHLLRVYYGTRVGQAY